MKISVPATSANLGPGFDSVGLAVSLYLTIEVLAQSDVWHIHHDLGAEVPCDERNLLLETALEVCADLTPHQLKMTSDIPLARGLGSSSSVIVAGIELANQLGNLQLTPTEKLALATKIEGHPDNVAPAIFGNLVIASTRDAKTSHVVAQMPETGLLAFIPDYELKTSDSRKVLPSEFAYKTAVAASSVANVAIAALLTGNMLLAGQMIEEDLFHENYRGSLVPEFAKIREIGHAEQAFATYLSGAGPTIMVMVAVAKLVNLKAKIQAENFSGKLLELHVDTVGVNVVK
ncbi:homoserine kinase [Lactococcus hodotermopsidis]|uniref:homoserine kinase n=1 Tax=Pseudolactococcus hodotermopsidis TaxID=2709157 RepID=UPI0015518FD1|nr:homoserine kinase [Lactococcus hodotermopsidis]